jgi:hypothetical protein
MLGKRSAQDSLFESGQAFRALVGDDSFYVYVADHRHELFADDDFATLYCLNNDRPSIAPSLLAVALLLQWYDNVSEEEAARRAKLDLGWKTALRLGLMDVPFVKSVLCEFRNKLILHKQQKRFFELSLKHARAQGYFKARNIKVALDTTPIFGRGAVEDTFNMLAEALRLLLYALAAEARANVEDYASAHDYSRYIAAKSFKGSFSTIDWDNPQDRQTVLDALVGDCERGLALARMVLECENEPSPERGEIQKTGTLLAQDVTMTNTGVGEINRGVAQDRIVSVHDTEMRHGRKSSSQCFNGYKAVLAAEPESKLITAVDLLPANAHDSQDTQTLIKGSAETTGAVVDVVIGYGAYGTFEAWLEAQEATTLYTLVAPAARPAETGFFTKDDFQIDLERGEVRCPAGKTTNKKARRAEKKFNGRVITYRMFCFSWKHCTACPLRVKCISEKTRFRTVAVHEHERLVNEAKSFQKTDCFHDIYRMRVEVEHRIRRLTHFGLRQARYFGSAKGLFQLAMTAALANLTLVATAGSPA